MDAQDPWATPDSGWSPSEDEAAEALRGIVPNATITSQQRSPLHNQEVGGVPDSMHTTGQAMDFTLPKGITSDQVRQQLESQGYPVTEYLNEGNHVHWGWRPKGNDPWATPAQDPWGTPTGAPQAPVNNQAPPGGSQKLTQAPEQPAPNPLTALMQGIVSSGRDVGQTFGYQQGEEQNPAAQPYAWSDVTHPMTFLAKTAYGLGKGAPMIAGGVLGASAGAAVPGAGETGVSELAGGALGAGLGTVLQTLGPAYAAELRKTPKDPNGAFDRALQTTELEGASGAVSWAAFGYAPFKSAIRNMLLQAIGIQPGIAVATKAAQNKLDNRPVDEGLGQAYASGAVGTLVPAAGHALASVALSGMGLHGDAAVAAQQAHMAARTEPSPMATPGQQPAARAPQADLTRSIGLEKPGVAPSVEGWELPGDKAPPQKTEEQAPLPSPVAPAIPAPEAAAPLSGGIARRDLEADTAVTASGREVPVRYAVVEAAHLVPSQGPNGEPNPNFPAELQPRDRSRAVSQNQVAQIAQNINPRLLDRSVSAADGAPIVAPSGVVESGNGRTMALQRAYAEGMPSADAYRQYLANAGYPVDGMTAPVLVRMREGEMTSDERQAFVREANQPAQLGMSATERAMVDASATPDHVLDLYRGGDVGLDRNRDFVRAFMQHAVPETEHAGMVAKDGTLSQDAVRRVRSALLAKAYADPDMVSSVVENQDSDTKAIGGALTDAAADWAKMRGLAANGEIPPALDQTANLLQAVNVVARARAEGRNVAEYVHQPDIFTGQTLDADVEGWLRLLFRNTKDWTKPVARDKLAEALRFYAQEAQKASMGANLLGQEPLGAGDILGAAKQRQYGAAVPQTGPSLSFGEDTRTFGRRGAGPGTPGPEAPGGARAPQAGVEGPGAAELPLPLVGRFGPKASNDFQFAAGPEGTKTGLGPEVRDYLQKAGVSLDRPEILAGALANYVRDRGMKFGTETLATISPGKTTSAHSDNRRSAVSFGPRLTEAFMNPAERLVTFHNHPSSNGPSKGDVASISYPGHASLNVITHQGHWHAVRLAAKQDVPDVGALTQVLENAYSMAEGHMYPVLQREVTAGNIDASLAGKLHTYGANRALEAAGLIDYVTNWPLPEAGRAVTEKAIDAASRAIKDVLNVNRSGPYGTGIRPAPGREGPYRHPEPVGFKVGMADLFAGLGGTAGPAGGARGETEGARLPQQPVRRPEQLRLLEDENRYERTRTPFYSALGRAIDESKMTRAPAKDWAGLIDNLKNKGVRQEEIDWSGVKDWLSKQTGPVTKQALQDHLRDNEVRVQEVHRSGEGPLPPADAYEKIHEWAYLGEGVTQPQREHAINALKALTDEEHETPGMNRQQALADLEESGAPEDAIDAYRAWLNGHGNFARYGEYTLPGGKNYRELLLTLPEKDKITREPSQTPPGWGGTEGGTEGFVERGNTGADYRGSHWVEPNVLAHIRFDDRIGPKGERILHAAEVQSDWHQQGRKGGYRGNLSDQDQSRLMELSTKPIGDMKPEEWGELASLQKRSGSVPDAPFKQTWHELAMKRLIRYAAEHRYDKLTWDTGDTNADRYDLSKQISKIRFEKTGTSGFTSLRDIESGRQGHGMLTAYDLNGRKVIERYVRGEEELAEKIGKEAAERLLAQEPKRVVESGTAKSQRELSGMDLKVGGEGMRGFYDRMLPQFVSKYVKKWGGKVERSHVVGRNAIDPDDLTDEQIAEVHGIGDEHFMSLTGRQRIELAKEAAEILSKEEGGQYTPVHSVDITPAMRESVMQGQALFEDENRYKAEPGAVDAKGQPLPQTIIPGAEKSAVQLAKARESAGKGLKTSKATQKEAGPLFAPGEGAGGGKQGSLFEDENRYARLSTDDRDALDRVARSHDWLGKFGGSGDTPRAKILSAIAGAYQAWQKGERLPDAARRIFAKVEKGEGLPGGFSDIPTARPTDTFRDKVARTTDNAMDLVHDVQMLVAPMAEGSNVARATAKDFANMQRLARWHGQRMDEHLKKGFTPEQRRRMWEAADEESVARQKGEPTSGIGLSKLTPEERTAVLEQQKDAQNVWEAARDMGMVQGEGLPSYVPRMMVQMAHSGVEPLGSDQGARSVPGIGRNLRTSTGQMRHRKYMTAEETEKAGGQKFGTQASVVRDIRTLPLATMRLREAVAGRALINKIKEIGQKTGDDTVVEGHEPAQSEHRWFTMDHPSFKTWRPKFVVDEKTGKVVTAKDQNGETTFERVPIYVRGDFEGPLRAVLSQDQGKLYQAMMDLKGKAMTSIMYSPLIHNAVEWGRALPAMPGKVASLKIYFEGNRAKRDPATMSEAIQHGLVPIGHRGGYQDISSIAQGDNIKAGRSWTAKALGAIPGLFSRDAKEAVYRAVDRMGDVWHNTLLWDRVGDLQMGLYTNMRDQLAKKGLQPDAAQYLAAHLANRYAGALPIEAMSGMARKIANLALFSRTYTLGNLGAMKDVVTGLPRDVQAQVERSSGNAGLAKVKSMARRKAIGILATDIALFYAGNSILQSAIAYISGRQDLSDIEKGYVDRLKGLLSKVDDSPLELLNPFADLQALSATSENEKGRQNRVLVGYDHNGTAIYARNPTGKIGEEFTNWLTNPLETLKAKFSTVLKPTYETFTNDAGFGRHVYDPNAKGFSGMAYNLGRIIETYMGSQVPLDSLNSGYNALTGKGSEIDVYKTLGPLAGVTFSKGAPGGPAVGALYDIEREQQAKTQEAMPGIIEKIRNGDVHGARADMKALGIPVRLQDYYIRTTRNPATRFDTRRARQAIRAATPEERARIEQLRGGQQ